MNAYCPPFVPMADVVVPGTSGEVKLDTFTVDQEQADGENLRTLLAGTFGMLRIDPGSYARLSRRGTLWMTDAPGERRSNFALLDAARGDVLINGLGIGMLPAALAQKPDVRSITVVELDPDVIAVMRPTMERVCPDARIIQGDAFLPERTGLNPHRTGGKFDTILSDIWPTICSDDYPEHIAVRRAWRKWLRTGGRHVMWHEWYVRNEWRKDRAANPDPWHAIYKFDMERAPSAAQQATALLRAKREGSPS